MSINNDYQKLEPGDTVRLFEVDGTAFGTGEVLRFHNYNLAYTEDEIAAANPLSPINLSETALDNRVTFQRAGAASYIGQDGKIYQAAANQWPLELAGRTEPEPAATNILKYSGNIGVSNWTKGAMTIVTNRPSPNNGISATKLTPLTSNGTHQLVQNVSGSLSQGDTLTTSIFAKANGYSVLQIIWGAGVNGISGSYANFDLNTGVTQGNADNIQIVPLADGWFFCSATTLVSGSASTTGNVGFGVIQDVSQTRSPSWAGDGVNGIDIWGPQAEKGPQPTSYIATSAAAVTRPAAAATIPANGASGIKITYSTGETASLSFGSAGSIALPAATKPWGTRYITKIEYIGGTPVYDESKLPAKSIWWQGNEYSAWPVQIEGIEASTSGSGAQPKLTVANLDGSITALCLAYDDMLQAVVTIHDTLAQYLDARNFAAGNVTADATQEKLQVFYIDSKSMETNISVEFTLSSPMDLQGLMIPTRQLHSLCTWCIRGKYRSGDGCDYAGTNYFDKHGNPVSDPSLDVCNGTLNTGCKPRFGANNELPFGGFPGTSLIKS